MEPPFGFVGIEPERHLVHLELAAAVLADSFVELQVVAAAEAAAGIDTEAAAATEAASEAAAADYTVYILLAAADPFDVAAI